MVLSIVFRLALENSSILHFHSSFRYNDGELGLCEDKSPLQDCEKITSDDERIWFKAYCQHCDEPDENKEWYFRDHQFQMLQVQMLDQELPHLGVSGGLMDDGAQFKLSDDIVKLCYDECNSKAKAEKAKAEKAKAKDEH